MLLPFSASRALPLKIPPKALPLETARALPLTRKPLKRLDLNFMDFA